MRGHLGLENGTNKVTEFDDVVRTLFAAPARVGRAELEMHEFLLVHALVVDPLFVVVVAVAVVIAVLVVGVLILVAVVVVVVVVAVVAVVVGEVSAVVVLA